jgi:hypothetical protein
MKNTIENFIPKNSGHNLAIVGELQFQSHSGKTNIKCLKRFQDSISMNERMDSKKPIEVGHNIIFLVLPDSSASREKSAIFFFTEGGISGQKDKNKHKMRGTKLGSQNFGTCTSAHKAENMRTHNVSNRRRHFWAN